MDWAFISKGKIKDIVAVNREDNKYPPNAANNILTIFISCPKNKFHIL